MLKGDTGAKRTWFYENGAFVAAALAAVLWHVVLSTNVGDDMVYFKPFWTVTVHSARSWHIAMRHGHRAW